MLKKFRLISLSILLVLFALAVTACSKNEKNDSKKDLKEYYGYTEISGKDTYIIVCDGDVLGMGFVEAGEVYVPYTEYRKNVDNKCYIDKNEKILVYTTANNIYDSYIGSGEYTDIDGNKLDYSCAVSLEVNGQYYVSAKFLKEMGAKIEYKTIDKPNRVVMTATFTNNVAVVKEDTKLRVDASERTQVLASVKKDEKLIVMSEKENFWQVIDGNGVKGYIKASAIGEVMTETIERDKTPEEYTHISKESKICLGWHQMEYEAGNDSIGELVEGSTGMNVISPTWYGLTDKNGNISSLADVSYVKKAHDRGLEVWALIDDFDYGDDGKYYVTEVLSHTTSRRMLIKNLMEDIKANDIDGINVDFECIGIGIADDYVEFVCELSVWCRREGIVLSVDMYVPSDINQYYNRKTVLEVADYLIIMGYDEHWSEAPKAGSVASLPYVEKGIVDTVNEGDSKRIINAIPFFTRIWSETPVEFAPDGSRIVEDSVKGSYALDSRAVGFGTAEKELDARGVNKFWVEDLSQYYAEYEEGNSLMRVWLEEERSVQAKIDVMKKFDLGGIACWRLGLEEDWVWKIISEYVGE